MPNKRDKNATRTQLVRDCELPASHAPRPHIVVHSATVEQPPPANENVGPVAGGSSGTQYQRPRPLSTLEDRHQLNLIRNAPIEPARSIRDLTKVAQDYVNNQASHKLNFVADRPVFQNLQTINVNDSVLELHCGTGPKKRKSFTRTDRDPEPVLTDYLRPVERLCENALHDWDLKPVTLECRTHAHDVNYANICEIFDGWDLD